MAEVFAVRVPAAAGVNRPLPCARISFHGGYSGGCIYHRSRTDDAFFPQAYDSQRWDFCALEDPDKRYLVDVVKNLETMIIPARKPVQILVKEDLYYPHPFVQDVLWATLHKFVEPVMMHWPRNKLREKALETVMQHAHYEDDNT